MPEAHAFLVLSALHPFISTGSTIGQLHGLRQVTPSGLSPNVSTVQVTRAHSHRVWGGCELVHVGDNRLHVVLTTYPLSPGMVVCIFLCGAGTGSSTERGQCLLSCHMSGRNGSSAAAPHLRQPTSCPQEHTELLGGQARRRC